MIKKKILFVCMGNICRSPAAEAVMKKLIADENLSDQFDVDSAGTISYHTGESADSRMISAGAKRGYNVDSIARQFNEKKDFESFDYIVTMDNDNYNNIKYLDDQNKYGNKIFKMADFLENHSSNKIPDPYYRGADGFEYVLDLLEDSTKGLLKKIINDDGRAVKS